MYKTLVCLTVVGVTLLGGVSPLRADTTRNSEFVQKVVDYTNEARVQEGLAPLVLNSQLQAAAQRKAALLAEFSEFNHYLHNGLSPWQLIRETGYQHSFAAENLAVHYRQPKVVVDAWLASPSHRANILDARGQDIGVGIAKGHWDGYDGYVMVQLFGQPVP